MAYDMNRHERCCESWVKGMADRRRDTERLDWLGAHEADISQTLDGGYMLAWIGDDAYPKWIADGKPTLREAIDEAMSIPIDAPSIPPAD